MSEPDSPTATSRPEAPPDERSAAPARFLATDDLAPEQVEAVLRHAAELKAGDPAAEERPLEGATLGLLFAEPSTRTRVSFQTATTALGGESVFLRSADLQSSNGEPPRDTARALSRYLDAVVVRLTDHDTVVEFAEHASVPVINGLTDRAHPCQALADLLTLRERFGDRAVELAWVGDANNVCRSLVLATAPTDVSLTVATPAGYGPDEATLERAAALGTAPTVTHDPAAAVAGADAVYTDVWTSMGQASSDARLAAFEGFQVDAALLPEEAVFMHCLPAHRGTEVTDAVIESERSIVWDQAENRQHAQAALLAHLLSEQSPSTRSR